MQVSLRNSLGCGLLTFGIFFEAGPACSQTADLFDPAPNQAVYAMAVQPDGRVILGGYFTVLDGQTRNYLGRVDASGGLDLNFSPGADREVYCLAVQSDLRILVGGSFSHVAGAARSYLARLHPDGALDASFNPNPNGTAFCLVEQPDGKVLVGGAFTTLAGQTCNRLARLNRDGKKDSSFGADFNATVYSLALQTNGMIVAGGYFTAVAGQICNHICRLNPDGTLDSSFNASADNTVRSVMLQADSGIVVLGDFATLNGQPRYYIGRLNADGTLDTGFNPSVNGNGLCTALQADGRILLGGPSSTLFHRYVDRLEPDGSFDTSFDVQADSWITALMLQPDGKVLVGGGFTNLAGQVRNCLGRVNNTEVALQSLAYDGVTATWQRGGAAPEVCWASFEANTNGTSWFGVTTGQRIAGGWQGSLTGVPLGATVRARGFVTGGYYAGSTWFVETSTGPPAISVPPLSRTNNAGDQTSFGVVAAGTGPIIYQWCKNGIFLTDTAQTAGTASPTLTLSNVLAADAAAYSVILASGNYSVTSQVATLTVIDPCIVGPPANQAANPGQSASFVVSATGTPALYYQWRKANQPIPGATTATLTLTNVQRADATLYDVVVTNNFGSVTSSVCSLMVNEVTADSLNPGADYYVSTLSVQLDGKVLVGGRFANLGGQPRGGLGRLNADGTLDPGFTASAAAQYSPAVGAFALQPGGLIIVGGYFTALNGQARTNLGRLKSDGTLDTRFNVPVDSGVGCLAMQTDGQILIGGAFTNVAGTKHLGLARLSADGVVDSSFNPVASANSYGSSGVMTLAVQMDGRVLVGGFFTNLCGQPRWSLGRLNPDGTLDTGFIADALNGSVYCLALQADGKILVGGQFTSLAGQPRKGFGRLNPDGSPDASFNPPINSYGVFALAVQADGKILVGGGFTNITGQTGNYLERLNPDGSLDTIFNPQPDNWVYTIALQPDGKILVGGLFNNLAGQPRAYLGRLNNTDAASQSLTCDGSTITWWRGGTCPEAELVRFDVSTNGNDLSSPGTPTRIAGGWQLTGLALATNAGVRARAYFENGSSWYAETLAGEPFLSIEPSSVTANAGSAVMLSAVGAGTSPLTYNWLRNGVPLANGGKISGAGTASLTISNVLGGDGGAYAMVVCNSFGCATSAVANLTVVDPYIAAQPISQIGNAGQAVIFSAIVRGTAPLAYQWRKASTVLGGATGSAVTLANLQLSDAGNYDVVVTNSFSSATSAVAVLTINGAVVDGFNPGANAAVYCLVPQPDGKVLAGGMFNSLGGQGRSRLARINANGTLDTAFHPAAFGGAAPFVTSLALQEDGKILVGGLFTNLAGQSYTNMGRLNPDGSIDSSFSPQPDGTVNAVAIQPDGRIIVGGRFADIGGQARRLIARVDSTGSADLTFNPGASGSFNTIYALSLQADGKIVVGGDFTTLAGWPRTYLGRLYPSGLIDYSFNPGANAPVLCLALQPDGKILVGGSFTTLAGQNRSYLGRLNANGSLDTGFNPSASNSVISFALQADGKILVAGSFTNLAGQPRNCIGRLNPDGTPDFTFEPQVTGGSPPLVYSLALQADGNVLVGGSFTTIANALRNSVARLLNTGPSTDSLDFDGSTITWMRAGTAPELLSATFEVSADGVTWSSLAPLSRIPGGWQLSHTPIPSGWALRGCGVVTGARGNASSWLVEATRPALGAPGFAQGQFGFNLIGSAGQELVLEASFDLVRWTALSTNTLSLGPYFLSDPDAPAFPARFYRARAQ